VVLASDRDLLSVTDVRAGPDECGGDSRATLREAIRPSEIHMLVSGMESGLSVEPSGTDVAEVPILQAKE
jgi:hypothetical protein